MTAPRGPWWASHWLRPFNDVEALDDLLSLVRATWSLSRIRAQLVAVRDETPELRTFVLRPNWRWRGFRPGQHVVLELDIAGVRHYRSFSIASAPGARTIEITVQRSGKVTRWMHDHWRVGSAVTLSRAGGGFVLPAASGPLLLVSAGSGITPVMSMLRTLAVQRPDADVVLVHSCRTPDDLPFARELRAIVQRMPGLRLQLHYSAPLGRLTPRGIAGCVPDFAGRDAFVCGPAAFMEAVAAHWQAEGCAHRLHRESFGAPIVAARAGAAVRVLAARSSKEFSGGAQALLVEAEAAGLSPRHGCRIGICQSCKCRKTRGTVENLLTGRVSAEPGEWIQLCVSAARTDVVLEI
ncbi:MAG TPA: ferredoxin reductase [Candidatus Binatia bacterium]|nr:ferredoxin reductase [Candidatus Binatia bacterium]